MRVLAVRRALLAAVLVGIAVPGAAAALVDATAERVRDEVLAHLVSAEGGDARPHRRRVATTYGWGCGHPFPPFVDARTPTTATFDEQLLEIDPQSPSLPPPPDRFAVFELEGRFTGRTDPVESGCPRSVPVFRVERWCYVGAPPGERASPDPSWPRCARRRR